MTVEKFATFNLQFSFQNQLFRIRPATDADIENLRVWKNTHKKFFYHQADISPEGQKNWFEKFKTQADQQIFVIQNDASLIGCIGFRKKTNQRVELFNLICGAAEFLKTGLMSQFYIHCKEQLQNLGFTEIFLEVLKTNTPGQKWYLKQGFHACGETGPSLVLTHDISVRI